MNKTVYILEFMRQIFVKTNDAYNSLKDQPRITTIMKIIILL